MANIKSQIKRNRQNEKRRVRNKAVRSEIKTRVKAAEAAAGTDEATDKLGVAIRQIDKAVSKGVLHKNKGARDKARLVKRITSA